MHKAVWGGAFAIAPLLTSLASHAAPNQYVVTPTVEEGEKEIDLKTGFERFRDCSSGAATSLGLGWGATSWWFTELYAKWHRPAGEAGGFDAWEWENRFQLTPTGRYPVDVGLLLEIERPKDRSEGYELSYGPLLQAEWDRWQGNLNLILERHVRASTPSDTELNYQWQVKYRASQAFEWGVQGFGGVGRWDRWAPSSEQQHQVGPAVFGKVRTGAGQGIRYNAALLFGANQAAPRTAVRFQAEYEF